MRANLLIYPALSIAILCPGCITRTQVRANLWLNNGLPDDLCEASVPKDQRSLVARRLWNHGFYRRLKDGGLDFISFCEPNALHWLAMYDKDLDELMDKSLPKEESK